MRYYFYDRKNACQARDPRIGTANPGKCLQTHDLFLVPRDGEQEVAICRVHLSGGGDLRLNRDLRPFRHLAEGAGFIGKHYAVEG